MMAITTTTSPHGRTTTSRAGGTLAGTWTLVRFIMRRDRVRIPIWIVAVVGAMVGVASSFADTFPTQADLDARAELVSSPLFIAFNGPGYGLDNYTFGAMVANEGLYIGVILAALMSIFLVVRHTRAEEESGRAELVRSAVVGRHAGTAAALIVVAGVNVVVGALTAAGLSSLDGLDQTGAQTFGASMAAAGLVFTAVAAVTAQVTAYARGAVGVGVAVLGATYVVRAIGDVSGAALSWASPFAWSLETRAFVDERAWPLLLSLVLAAALIVTALGLSTRRDVGAAMVPPRPGPSAASDRLIRPAGTALRLQRGSLIGWAAGVAVLGASFGPLVADVEEFATANEQFQDIIARAGDSSLRDSFLGAVTMIMALLVTGFAIQSMTRMRSEENAGRAEPLLATGLSRTRWSGGYLSVALGGSLLIMVAGSLCFGAVAAISEGDPALLTDGLAAGLTHVPAVWVVIGIVMAMIGLVPNATRAGWLVLVYSVIVDLMGPALGVGDTARNLSPFGHVPRLPAQEFSAVPVVMLMAIAIMLIAIGQAAFRRRDIHSR